mmetsp:Transcript_17594/g.26360  ORF Transcript_17594/g.26360 Transcript_17594/m.26360 type:complete len:462 (-) Transcript_17594:112-1497(-)|eukprot:CAMPEP_0167756376 /NCGR_PEP_ID=MMETSP0110_2-20121227/9353_1 /TAXON_ID=629695 /ORGANISM="Gymnochlora sp., Strain CCMP2014" /LENGTH=461 /DNA_ID=CAMNT_0007642483 /DNA_START=145 /DNA_END=1530 /DNA_ORIENTATION=+
MAALGSMRLGVSILGIPVLPSNLFQKVRDSTGREVTTYTAPERIKRVDPREDPWNDKTSSDSDKDAEKEVLPDGSIVQELKLPENMQELSYEGFQQAVSARDQWFSKAARNEDRVMFETRQRRRRRMIDIKLKELEKVKAEEFEKERDRNKTISSLNGTSALDHVTKLGFDGDPCRLFLLPAPHKGKTWTVTEEMISRQFKRFSLLVHPDKHKKSKRNFKRAQEAFKIIGQAQDKLRELLEKTIRIKREEQEVEILKDKENLVNDLERRVAEYNVEKRRRNPEFTIVGEDGARGFFEGNTKQLNNMEDDRYKEAMERLKFQSNNEYIEVNGEQVLEKTQPYSQNERPVGTGDNEEEGYWYWAPGEPRDDIDPDENGEWLWATGKPPEEGVEYYEEEKLEPSKQDALQTASRIVETAEKAIVEESKNNDFEVFEEQEPMKKPKRKKRKVSLRDKMNQLFGRA